MAKSDQSRGCLGALFPFLAKPNEESIVEFPYRLRDDFLSPAEFSFFKVLSSMISPRLAIQSKVRLSDVFFVSQPNKNLNYFNYIAQKHIDFLVCDSVDMKPLLGIELDDASHQAEKRQKRDELINQVFQAANLPLIHIPVQREYNSREIAPLIAPYVREKFSKQKPTSTPEATGEAASVSTVQSPVEVPICPKCGIPMVLRTASQGEHKGKQFWGCSNYPRCKEVKAYNG